MLGGVDEHCCVAGFGLCFWGVGFVFFFSFLFLGGFRGLLDTYVENMVGEEE